MMNATRWLGPQALASRVTTRLRARADRTLVDFDDDPDPTMPAVDFDDDDPTVPADLVASPSRPSTLQRYEIGRLLGQGAFGRVFAARDTKLGRFVALKLLNSEHAADPEIRRRFVQEAHAAACIAHPGIITIFDRGVQESTNTAYIVMELLPGESLQARIARCGRMSSVKAREIGRQIASALEAAHRSGVIHRDLKPENIFVMPDLSMGDRERVKVLDFGFAKPTRTANVATAVSAVFGTPCYMSPEQLESARDADHRSDIYALGCTLFELVTGRPPFVGSLRELTMQHLSAPPPSLRAFVPDACPELDALVQRMLAKDPAARPPTMQHVEQALGDPPDAGARAELPPPAVELPLVPEAMHGVRVARRPLRFIAAVVGAALCLTCGPTGTGREPLVLADDTVANPIEPGCGIAGYGDHTARHESPGSRVHDRLKSVEPTR